MKDKGHKIRTKMKETIQEENKANKEIKTKEESKIWIKGTKITKSERNKETKGI